MHCPSIVLAHLLLTLATGSVSIESGQEDGHPDADSAEQVPARGLPNCVLPDLDTFAKPLCDGSKKYEFGNDVLYYNDSTVVYHGTCRSTNAMVAVKTIKANEGTPDDLIIMEARVLKLLDHPHIVRLLDVFHDPCMQCNLVTEFMKYGTLERFSRLYANTNPLDAHFAAGIARQLLQAIAYLHSIPVTHCDIKPSNVMLSQTGVKIIDFDLCIVATECTVARGTTLFESPEMLHLACRGPCITEAGLPKTDIWSLGIMLLSFWENPYPGWETMNELGFVIKFQRYNGPWAEPLYTNVPIEARRLVKWCLVNDPRDRATADELLKLDYIAKSMDDEQVSAFICAQSILT